MKSKRRLIFPAGHFRCFFATFRRTRFIFRRRTGIMGGKERVEKRRVATVAASF